MKRMPGVSVATVKSVDDPAGEGRVQLRFDELPDMPASDWAPVAVPLAGASRGMYFMPEVGDEVLVSFEKGSFDHPFVIGYLWNGSDRPPDKDSKNRVIVTPGGHELRLEDSGSKKIVVKSSANQTITLDDGAGTITVKTGQSTVTLAASSITITGGGRSIALSGGQVAFT